MLLGLLRSPKDDFSLPYSTSSNTSTSRKVPGWFKTHQPKPLQTHQKHPTTFKTVRFWLPPPPKHSKNLQDPIQVWPPFQAPALANTLALQDHRLASWCLETVDSWHPGRWVDVSWLSSAPLKCFFTSATSASYGDLKIEEDNFKRTMENVLFRCTFLKRSWSRKKCSSMVNLQSFSRLKVPWSLRAFTSSMVRWNVVPIEDENEHRGHLHD